MSAPENSIAVEVLDAAINAWFGTVPESKDQQELFRNRMRAALAAAGVDFAALGRVSHAALSAQPEQS